MQKLVMGNFVKLCKRAYLLHTLFNKKVLALLVSFCFKLGCIGFFLPEKYLLSMEKDTEQKIPEEAYTLIINNQLPIVLDTVTSAVLTRIFPVSSKNITFSYPLSTYQCFQELLLLWRNYKGKVEREELISKLNAAIDIQESKEKSGSGDYILLFIKYLYHEEHSDVRERDLAHVIRKCLRERYFFTINVEQGLNSLTSKVYVFHKIADFFPFLKTAFLFEENRRFTLQHEVNITALGFLVEHILREWYLFAHKHSLDFKQTCLSNDSKELVLLLYKALVTLFNTYDHNKHFEGILELACNSDLEPLKIALLRYALGQDDREHLLSVFALPLAESLFPLALSHDNAARALKWINAMNRNPKFSIALSTIEEKYTSYLVHNIVELSKNSEFCKFFAQEPNRRHVEHTVNQKLMKTYHYTFAHQQEFSVEKDITCWCQAKEMISAQDELNFRKPILVGFSDGTIQIWSQSRKDEYILKQSKKLHDKALCALTQSDSPLFSFCSSSVDGTIRLWKRGVLTEERALVGHTDRVGTIIEASQMSFSVEDFVFPLVWLYPWEQFEPSLILLSGSRDTTIRAWNCKDGKCLLVLSGHTKEISAIEALNSRTLVSTSLDGTMRIWSTETKECLKTIMLEDAIGITSLLKISENRVIVGLENGNLYCIDLLKEAPYFSIKRLENHDASVIRICSLDETHFVTCSRDKNVKIWDLKALGCIQVLGHQSPLCSLCILDTYTLVTACEDKTVHIWSRPQFYSSLDAIKALGITSFQKCLTGKNTL